MPNFMPRRLYCPIRRLVVPRSAELGRYAAPLVGVIVDSITFQS